MRLLLVTPAGSYRTGDFLDAARDMDCDIVVASDASPAIPGSWLQVPLGDPSAAGWLVGRVGAIDGVVGTDGPAVGVATETARLLGLPSSPSAAMATAEDKHRQRCAAGAAGLRQPRFILVDGVSGPSWDVFPAVVKPLDRSASQGVLRADSRGELGAAIDRVRGIVGEGAPLLVEAFVPGIEVAVEGLMRDGELTVLAVFDKPDTPLGPTFPETLLVSPARLEADVFDRLTVAAQQAVAAIGLSEGPVHVECKVDGDRIWFLELAARTIGGLCARSLGHGGVSLEELVIRHALRLPLPTPRTDGGATGVLMLPVERTGRLGAVRGVDAARAVPGVTDVVIAVGAGERVVALPAGDRYLGFVFARGESADGVEVALRAAWATLEVEVTAS